LPTACDFRSPQPPAQPLWDSVTAGTLLTLIACTEGVFESIQRVSASRFGWANRCCGRPQLLPLDVGNGTCYLYTGSLGYLGLRRAHPGTEAAWFTQLRSGLGAVR
jgi:hypothetical protein